MAESDLFYQQMNNPTWPPSSDNYELPPSPRGRPNASDHVANSYSQVGCSGPPHVGGYAYPPGQPMPLQMYGYMDPHATASQYGTPFMHACEGRSLVHADPFGLMDLSSASATTGDNEADPHPAQTRPQHLTANTVWNSGAYEYPQPIGIDPLHRAYTNGNPGYNYQTSAGPQNGPSDILSSHHAIDPTRGLAQNTILAPPTRNTKATAANPSMYSPGAPGKLRKLRLRTSDSDLSSLSTRVGSTGDEGGDERDHWGESKSAGKNAAATTTKDAKRPANSWILYRQEKHPIVLKQHAGITNNNISKIVAEWWKNEPEEIKRIYKSRAEEERRRHRLLHPDYKYAPRKNKQRRSRVKKEKLDRGKSSTAGGANRAKQAPMSDDSDAALNSLKPKLPTLPVALPISAEPWSPGKDPGAFSFDPHHFDTRQLLMAAGSSSATLVPWDDNDPGLHSVYAPGHNPSSAGPFDHYSSALADDLSVYLPSHLYPVHPAHSPFPVHNIPHIRPSVVPSQMPTLSAAPPFPPLLDPTTPNVVSDFVSAPTQHVFSGSAGPPSEQQFNGLADNKEDSPFRGSDFPFTSLGMTLPGDEKPNAFGTDADAVLASDDFVSVVDLFLSDGPQDLQVQLP